MIPCRAEVEEVLAFIRASLDEEKMPHATEQADENPDAWTVCAYDGTHINSGILGWSRMGQLTFACFDRSRANHDAAEGVPEDASKCWFTVPSAVDFVRHLTGELREWRLAVALAESQREDLEAA